MLKRIGITLLIASATFASAKSGAAVFQMCKGCHGVRGERPALGVSAVIKGQNAALTVKQLKGYRAGALDQHGMGKLMNKYAKKLSDKEIEAVARYIAKLK
jgi:cytochrome c553